MEKKSFKVDRYYHYYYVTMQILRDSAVVESINVMFEKNDLEDEDSEFGENNP